MRNSAIGQQVLQDVAGALVESLSDASAKFPRKEAYDTLAHFAADSNVRISLDTPPFKAPMVKLDDGDFTLTDIDNHEWHLEALSGKIVVMQAVSANHAVDGVVVLGITAERATTGKKFASRQQMGFPVLLDPGAKADKAFDVRITPRTLVFGRQGRLAAQTTGQTGVKPAWRNSKK